MHNQSDYGYSTGAVSMRCIACGSMELNCCDGTMGNQFIETYAGIRIHFVEGEGFHASASCSVHFGYTDTVREIRDEIDGYLFDEAGRDPGQPPPDSPALDAPWWEQR